MKEASNLPTEEDPLGALRRSLNSSAAEIAMAPIKDVRDLLVHELERAENTEIQGAAMLRRFVIATSSPRLQTLLQQRIHEGERVSSDIRGALEQYSSRHRQVGNRAASVLIWQNERLLKRAGNPEVRDIIILSGAQKLQHYCLSCWGTLRLLAKLLNDKEIALHLKAAIEEGQRWDRQLTDYALSGRERIIFADKHQTSARKA